MPSPLAHSQPPIIATAMAEIPIVCNADLIVRRGRGQPDSAEWSDEDARRLSHSVQQLVLTLLERCDLPHHVGPMLGHHIDVATRIAGLE